MKPWLTSAQAMEFTGLTRHALTALADERPEILMPRKSVDCHRRYRTVVLAQVVHGMSEPAALELVRGKAS